MRRNGGCQSVATACGVVMKTLIWRPLTRRRAHACVAYILVYVSYMPKSLAYLACGVVQAVCRLVPWLSGVWCLVLPSASLSSHTVLLVLQNMLIKCATNTSSPLFVFFVFCMLRRNRNTVIVTPPGTIPYFLLDGNIATPTPAEETVLLLFGFACRLHHTYARSIASPANTHRQTSPSERQIYKRSRHAQIFLPNLPRNCPVFAAESLAMTAD